MSEDAGLRIVAGLPSGVPPGAAHRQAFETVLTALADRGVEVECFAEHQRLDEPVAGLPIFHYLRLPERHRAEPFDAAIYPLERDTGPYEAIYWMMHRFPGCVWLHDPALHHMAVSGLALSDRLPGYLEFLEGEYGDLAGSMAETVVEGWGSAAFYRHFDLTGPILAEQNAVVTPWEALARRVEEDLAGKAVTAIPLPLARVPGPPGHGEGAADEDRGVEEGSVSGTDRRGESAGGEAASTGPHVVRFVSTNPSFLAAEMWALEELVEALPGARVEICLPPVIRDVVYGPAAARRGLEGRIGWLPIDEWDELADAVEDADIVAFLREDLRGGELALLHRALDAGSLVLVPELPLYDDLPEGGVVRIPFGAGLGRGLAAAVRELLDDVELLRGVRAAGREHVRSLPDAGEVAEAWIEWIGALREAGTTAELRPLSTPTWERLRADLEAACVSDAMAVAPAREILEVLDEQLERVRGDRG